MSILVTGCGGFIGYHLTKRLIESGEHVIGMDNLNDYYSVRLKRARVQQLTEIPNFDFWENDITQINKLGITNSRNDIHSIVHLAAQAGVRYSIENPSAYVHSNLIGHCEVLEFARRQNISNMLYASSSSVYGGNVKVPFEEKDETNSPVSFYGATKKSNELLSYSYAKLYNIALTGFRFFTVYGEWGRPDMAYWIFADKITRGDPINIFNNGKMMRDFTYIGDIVEGLFSAVTKKTVQSSLSIPHRIFNLGNNQPIQLLEMIELLEQKTWQKGNQKLSPDAAWGCGENVG